jgi:hypothetical protein
MSETSIEIVNPVGVGESKQTGLARRKHGSLHGLRVGLLDNNKPNADKFLQFVGDLLKRRAGDIELVALCKMSRTEADCLPELIARCDVVINAFAD